MRRTNNVNFKKTPNSPENRDQWVLDHGDSEYDFSLKTDLIWNLHGRKPPYAKFQEYLAFFMGFNFIQKSYFKGKQRVEDPQYPAQKHGFCVLKSTWTGSGSF